MIAMFKYIVKRAILTILSIVVVISILKLAMEYAMLKTWGEELSTDVMLDLLFRDFFTYMEGLFTSFDWGISTFKGEPVWELVADKLSVSIGYNLIALLIYVPAGIILGIFAAIHNNTWVDHAFTNVSMFFSSVPSFILTFILILIFGYWLEILPPMEPFAFESDWEKALGYVIPVTSLVAIPVSRFALLIRGELIDSFAQDYFLLLKAKGLNKRQRIMRHSLKESFVVILPEIVPMAVFVFGMSFVIEYLYRVPGLADLFLESLIMRSAMYNYLYIDTNVVVAIGVLIFSMISIFALVTDVLMVVVDPRIRITGKKTN